MGGFFQGGESGLIADVSQSDTDVAEQAGAFGAKDGCAGETAIELCIIEGKELEQIWGGEIGSGVGFHHLAFASEAVPGANGEAIVAAENAVANQGAKFERDGAFEFDGEVGDAEARIELEGGFDG